MNFDSGVLDNNEKITYALRSLYSRHGYSQYKMSKFEEYDLYSGNKDFLVSDSVITFNDTNGRLMALKPDVTLSIIKNNRGFKGGVLKLCYDENVYRVSKGTGSFREIMQIGLECIGEVDDFCIGEVLWLAAESLKTVSPDFVLDISDLDLIGAFIDNISSDAEIRKALMKCIGEKNLHGISAICAQNSIGESAAEPLKKLIMTYGTAREVLTQVKELAAGIGAESAADSLARAVSIFDNYEFADRIHIDFSVVGDMKYYNGVVFKGFINGVPGSVLSGGRYDKLMARLHDNSKGIGFAVYLDMLEDINKEEKEYDADIMLVYSPGSDPAGLREAADKLTAEGKSVFVAAEGNQSVRCREIYKYADGEVRSLE